MTPSAGAKPDPEDDAGAEPTARVVGTVASHLEDRIARSERHLRDLINEMDRRIGQRFDAMATAVEAAFAAAKEKSQSHNDLIKAMERQAATFLTRAEADAKFVALSEKIAQVISWQERNEGVDFGTARNKASSVVTTNMVIAAVGLILAVLVVMLNVFTGA